MIVMALVADTLPAVAVNVTFAPVPPPTAVTTPLDEMIAFVGSLDVQVGVTEVGRLLASSTTAVNAAV